ncbi:unnamed protein product [Parascedosporium putredinis]|uniref:Uncharacterized protein n=1 Tax=Parascedosporium putredinis TaxID=1442378 RepID=A0A9P1MA00_9PEZI|nr:unnamed protein product [Parascedosporium putredinis]CAI7996527.1 unnamed protein product [Parascedosporium putredinis]
MNIDAGAGRRSDPVDALEPDSEHFEGVGVFVGQETLAHMLAGIDQSSQRDSERVHRVTERSVQVPITYQKLSTSFEKMR